MTNLVRVSFVLFLTLGMSICIYGLTGLNWPHALPWDNPSTFIRFFLFVCIVAITLEISCRLSKLSPIQIAPFAYIIIAFISFQIWPFFIVSLFILSSCVLGRHIITIIYNDRISTSIDFLVGAGIFGTIVSLLAHYPVNFPVIYISILLVPLLICKENTVDIAIEFKNFLCIPALRHKIIHQIEIVLVTLSIVYAVLSLLPDVEYDSLVMHLSVASQLNSMYKWGFNPNLYSFAVMPMLADWIYAFNYMLCGDVGSNLINFFFVIILVYLVRDLIIVIGGSEASGWAGGLFLLSSPLTFLEGTTLHVEAIWAAYILSAIIIILRHIHNWRNGHRSILLFSFLMGCALATKSITLLLLLPISATFILSIRSALNYNIVISTISGAILFLIIGGIPYLNAFVITGNPVFPFFNLIFKSNFFPLENFKDVRWQHRFSIDTLYKMTFDSSKFLEARAGASGFQWIVFLPATLFLITLKPSKALLVMLIGISSAALIFFFTGTYLRYVYPSAILLIAVIAVGIDMFFKNSNFYYRLLLGFVFIFVVLFNCIFINSAARHGDFPLFAVFDKNSIDEYIIHRAPERMLVSFINMLNNHQNPVAFISNPFFAGLQADALLASWYNKKFMDSILTAQSESDMVNVLIEYNVDYLLVDNRWENGSLNLSLKNESAQVANIKKITNELFSIGDLSVRRIDPELRFHRELLRNPEFSSVDGWVLFPGAVFNPELRTVLVSEPSPVFQSVTVKSGQQYRNSIVEKCSDSGGIGRLQINWHDKNSVFIKSDIKTFDCSVDWTEREMTVVAPRDATSATVYSSSHSNVPVLFKRNSFLQ